MPLAVGNRLQLRVYCTAGDQCAINVLEYEVTAVAGLTDFQDFIDVFSNHVAGNYKAAMGPGSTYYGVDMRVRAGLNFGPTFTSRGGSGAGTGTGDTLPRHVCGIIGKSSNGTGRRGRGRIYIPFPTEGSNGATGLVSSGYQSALTAIASVLGPTQVIDGGGDGTATLKMLIVDKATGESSEVVALHARSKWGTQRRRGDYGRVNAPGF